jgi:exodeoxyribonuclease VII large subunit
MAEQIDEKTVFSLLEVTQSVQRTLSERYTSSFWIKAEMNKLNYYAASGHCYPELVEKRDEKVIAQIRAIIWRDDFRRINEHFKHLLNEPLKDGIKILFQAKISFDPVHGLSLQILDIDPAYALGEIERAKKATIDQLQKEGIFDANRKQGLPLLPQRVAVISVDSSKGYADFTKVIDGNPWNYTFFHLLFPALLQGERAIESIILQLHQIRKVIHHFDVVAIIRGGGGDVGLSSFNNYRLSKEIANFPIPVITGIGHATNETVVEMVAYKNSITPTALAEYLLQQFHNFSVPVRNAEATLVDKSERIIREASLGFQNTVRYFKSVTRHMISKNHHDVQAHSQMLFYQANYFVKHRDLELTNMERSIQLMSPLNVLKRGYSITLFKGKSIKSNESVREGDLLKTVLYTGSLTSRVKSTGKKDDL